MKSLKKTIIIFPVLISILIFSSLAAYAVSDFEKKVAKKNYERLEEEFGFAKLNRVTLSKLDRIFNDLAKAAKKDNPDIEFKLHVLDSPALNALYIGDGHVMIFKGLLDNLDNNHQIAGVLAHEIGHGINNDIQDNINLIQGIQIGSMLIDALRDEESSDLSKIIENVAWTLVSKGFSRDQEQEADRYAVFLMEKIDYNPEGFVEALKVLKRESGVKGESELLELFSSHPNLGKRIEYTSNLVRKIKGAKRTFSDPISAGDRFAKALLLGDDRLLYETYAEIIHQNLSFEEFKKRDELRQIRDKLDKIGNRKSLKYRVELRNQQEGTARVAVLYYKSNGKKKEPSLALALDLIHDRFGWKVIREPMVY